MKQYCKFKIGDKVRILPRATVVGVESEDVGKVGVISQIRDDICEWHGFEIQMGEICEARGYIPEWCVGFGMIKLLPRKNEQLLFNFMSE